MNNHFKNILSLPCFFTQKGKNKIAFTSIVKWLNIKLVISQLDQNVKVIFQFKCQRLLYKNVEISLLRKLICQ